MDSSGAKRRRAQRACHFCRQRKMRCGNEQPNCLNCVAYKEICYYEQGPKKARPSNSRISQLEEENRSLQERLAQAKAGKEIASKTSTKRPLPNNSTLSDELSSASSGESHGRSTLTPSPSRSNMNSENPEYHGPSSVFFDEAAPKNKQELENEPQKEDALTNLMAEAATQRQLENLHLTSHQLDLDGVNADLAAEMLSVFWIRSNSLFMLIYRPVFMRDWANGGPYFSKLLLNAIYFNASRYITDPRHGATGLKLGERFRKRFKDLLESSYDKSRITTMQALLLVSTSLSAVGKDRSVAWLYSGLSFRMMFDLGLHTSRSDPKKAPEPSLEDLESNRRLFWSAFVIDKLQSFYHGRPANVQEADSMVPLLFNDQYEELEQWNPLPSTTVSKGPYAPMYCVSNFLNLCKLSVIMNKIINKIYREKSEIQGPEAATKNLNQLNQELEEWQQSLPPHMKVSPSSIDSGGIALPSPNIFVTVIMFHVVQILLHRPFVSYGHLQSVLPDVAIDSFSNCAAAAKCIAQYLEAYDYAHSLKFAPFFFFYASFVSATIHVRIAAQRHLNSDAFECLRLCLSVYDQNEMNNPAVKKAKAIIYKLMNRMGVKLPEGNPQMPHSSVTSKKKVQSPAITKHRINSESFARNVSTPEIISQMDLLQEWDINDLDFDAILQSFRSHDAGIGNTDAMNINYPTMAQTMDNSISWSTSTVNQPPVEPFNYMNQFGGGNMDDALFGFNISSKEDEWASPQSGASEQFQGTYDIH